MDTQRNIIIKKTFIFYWRRPTPPLFIGGAEICQNILAIELAKNGYKVVCIGSFEDPNFPTQEKYNYYINEIKYNSDIYNITFNNDSIEYYYKKIKCIVLPQKKLLDNFHQNISNYMYPTIITSMENSSEFIKKSKIFNIKTVAWLHSCFENEISLIKEFPTVIIATSKYIQNFVYNTYNIKVKLFYPPFDFDLSTNNRKKYVTLINPVPQKGSDLLIQIANNMPSISFLAIEGWYKNNEFLNKKTSKYIILKFTK